MEREWTHAQTRDESASQVAGRTPGTLVEAGPGHCGSNSKREEEEGTCLDRIVEEEVKRSELKKVSLVPSLESEKDIELDLGNSPTLIFCRCFLASLFPGVWQPMQATGLLLPAACMHADAGMRLH